MLMTYIAEYIISLSHVWQQDWNTWFILHLEFKRKLIWKVTDKTFLAESLKLFHNATCDAVWGPISLWPVLVVLHRDKDPPFTPIDQTEGRIQLPRKIKYIVLYTSHFMAEKEPVFLTNLHLNLQPMINAVFSIYLEMDTLLPWFQLQNLKQIFSHKTATEDG